MAYINVEEAINAVNGLRGNCDSRFYDEAIIDVKSELLALPTTDAAQQEWIPVTERLPEDGTDVLAYQNRGEETRLVPANYGCGVWFDCFFDCEADHITHWMPLPQPPKEGE